MNELAQSLSVRRMETQILSTHRAVGWNKWTPHCLIPPDGKFGRMVIM